MKLFRAAVAAGSLVIVTAALTGLTSAAAYAAPSAQDTLFFQQAHQANLAEIAAGNLAIQKGASQQVRDLGARFVTDHTNLDQGLQQAAATLGVALPTTPNAQQQDVQAQLQNASGATFDSLFISTQLTGHMQVMQLGETELADGTDPTAKQVVATAAPVVAAHLALLHAAATALGVPVPAGVQQR
jgi:putative membrane protein